MKFFIFLLAVSLFGFGGCGNGRDMAGVSSHYISGTAAEQEMLNNFFNLLASKPNNSEEQFAVVREIANVYLRQSDYGRLINFLGSRIHRYPDNPFNPFFLFTIAFAYRQLEAYPITALYLHRIVKNYPDLIVKGESIHLASLKQLITLTDNPRQRVWYYEELLTRFYDQIDPGPVFFMLGQAYEGIGAWNNAIRAYTQFLSFPGTDVPGFPEATIYARRIVYFNNSAKDWTFESLNALVAAVKAAIDAGSSARLWRYHARVNFFTRTWEQNDTMEGGVAGHGIFNLSDFMRGGRVRYADTLHPSSNANEAFLRTWGWAGFIPVWYLYFRKIHFPMDPEIHGNWEWAGIFYGDKF